MANTHVSFWNNSGPWAGLECVDEGFMEGEIWLVALYLTYLSTQVPGEPLTIPGLIDLQMTDEACEEYVVLPTILHRPHVVLSTVQTRRLRRYVEGFEFEDLMEQYRESDFYEFCFVEDEDGGHAGLLEKFTGDLKQCQRVVFIYGLGQDEGADWCLRYAENIIQSINRDSRIRV